MSADSIDHLVSSDWLAAELGSDDLRVFDTTVLIGTDAGGAFRVESGYEAWAEGHIPGSGHLDLVTELSDGEAPLLFTAPSADVLANAFAARGVGDDTRVVLYDSLLNMWATRAWWLLRSIGFDRAAVLDGGWNAWTSDGRTASQDPAPEHGRSNLTQRPRPGTFVDSAHVEQAVGDASTCILNSLPQANHDGTDAGYGRPGHIPGASNVPAQGLVDPETHRYRPLEELQNEFTEAGTEGRAVITYCGGGIAATSDAFVLHLLGHGDLAVYDGSLRDWIDLGLPLET